MSFKETELGFEYKEKNYFIFFGKKDSSLENLKKAYQNFIFKPLRQVHGNELLHTTSQSQDNLQADAHWTEEKNVALISKTADCIPVLGYDLNAQRILAIHAGWRGIQNRIVPKSLSTLGSKWKLFIGPHIMADSFEIQQDCLKLLKECTDLSEKEWFNGGHADLLKILKSQVKEHDINTFVRDTKSDSRFHSFRRDKDLAGRQNNFLIIL